jgi:hypothetical protein
MESPVGNVTFTGVSDSENDLLRQVTKPGKPFNAYRMNDDVRSWRSFTRRATFSKRKSVAIGLRRTEDRCRVHNHEGPEILLEYTGADVPGKIQDDIRKIWMDSLTEAVRIRGAEKPVAQTLPQRWLLEGESRHREESSAGDTHRFVFTIELGAKYKDPDWQIDGVDKDMSEESESDIHGSAGDVLASPDDFPEPC